MSKRERTLSTPRHTREWRATASRLAYGALFIVVLPLALALWAARLDRLVPLPATGAPLAGAIVAMLGGALMAAAAAALWIHGRGLPMSPYPPREFVSRGPYRYVSHPIYIGAVLVSSGVALALRSPSGLWIVTPLLAAMAAAWVFGYERDATRARFGSAMRAPLLRLPPPSDDSPTRWDRASACALVLLPWVALRLAFAWLGMPHDAIADWRDWRWSRSLPLPPWTVAVGALAGAFVLMAPFAARSRRELRWFMTRGWLAMAALPLPLTWLLLAARVYGRRWPRLAFLWWGIAAAVAAGSLTTSANPIVHALASLVVFAAVARAEWIWERVRRGTERVANSWRELTLGPVRFMSHGVYAALGVWLGIFLATTLAGRDSVATILLIAAASIVGAALWAQIIEGSPQLLRPYGYYGGAIGGVAGTLLAGALGADFWAIAAAYTVGGSLTQAIGRFRCLVQGCCHGSECPAWLGIRYTHPRSRVTRLSSLGGRSLYPTQLYSMVWMLVVAAILVRLWMLHAGLQMIVGLYFILAGLGRFVEEHYRGEPQTMVWRGFRLYQWLAIAYVPAGAALTCFGWTPAPDPVLPSTGAMLGITAFAILTDFAFGADFPRLNVRFSRLV